MSTSVRLKCPYCSTQIKVQVEPADWTRREVVNCCVEDGGCDREFVLEYKAEISGTVIPLDYSKTKSIS